nr:hypothetical protein [Volvox reticuliferus]
MRTIIFWYAALVLSAYFDIVVGLQIVFKEPQLSFSSPELEQPKYTIMLNSQGSKMQLASNALGVLPLPVQCPRVHLATADGWSYLCTIPMKDCIMGMKRQVHGVLHMDTPPSTLELPFTLLEELSALCFYRQEGLWTYEVCYRKHVRQFRQDSSGKSEDFSCGTYDVRRHQDESIKEDVNSYRHPIRYVSHIFVGGARCELTGQQRSAEVRFTCLPDINDNVVIAIKEFPACNYVFLVNAPALCKHKEFQLPPQHDFSILCEPR